VWRTYFRPQANNQSRIPTRFPFFHDDLGRIVVLIKIDPAHHFPLIGGVYPIRLDNQLQPPDISRIHRCKSRQEQQRGVVSLNRDFSPIRYSLMCCTNSTLPENTGRSSNLHKRQTPESGGGGDVGNRRVVGNAATYHSYTRVRSSAGKPLE
jgi:hypothetical protein